MQEGYRYVGTTYNDKKNGIDYRKDGTIMFTHEADAYKRMEYMAREYTVSSKYPTGKEQSSYLLSNGKVLMMPDNWNNGSLSVLAPGYDRQNNTLTDADGNKYSYVAQIHTHPIGSDKTLSGSDCSFAKADMKIPVFVMHGDGNVYMGIHYPESGLWLNGGNGIGRVRDMMSGKRTLYGAALQLRRRYK